MERFLIVAVLLTALIFMLSCGDSASERVNEMGGVTAGQIIENPNAYVGKTVTVSGEVEEIFGPQAFSMDSGLTAGELLVLGREPFPQVPEAENRAYVISDTVTVTGVVQMMVTADIERELGWDLTPEVEAEYNAKPVLIARDINFRPGNRENNVNTTGLPTGNDNTAQSAVKGNVSNLNGNMSANLHSAEGNKNANRNQSSGNTNTGINSNQRTEGGNVITDVGTYGSTNDKSSLVNREGDFTNVRVNRIVGPRTFTIGSAKSELYVILDDESARGVGTQGNIKVGDHLNIRGRFESLNDTEISNIQNNRFRPLTNQERAFLRTTQIYFQTNEINKVK